MQRKYISVSFYLLVTLLFFGYLTLQMRIILFPPRLELAGEDIIEASVGEEVGVRGRADTLSRVFFNGDEVSIDREGNFVQPITVHGGITRVTITAQNRFGKEHTKHVTIIARE